jgi:hypothetical protein
MNERSIGAIATLALACAVGAGAKAESDAPRTRREAAAEWSADGLQKTTVKGLDVVYVRPGASLAGYAKVLLRPVTVTFRREWLATQPAGSPYRMQADDAQRIKGRLALLVREELLEELGKGGYQLADSAADDVLEVQMSIIDLHPTAPDVRTAGRVEVFAFSSGEMTLVAELRDSVSGDLAMRIFDRAQALETARPRRITVVENEFEARKAASAWARALRTELDLAKAVGAPH